MTEKDASDHMLKAKGRSQRSLLAEELDAKMTEEDLIPGLRPIAFANPGKHPSRDAGRRRRSTLAVPGLVDSPGEPEDTEGRVTFFYGEPLDDPASMELAVAHEGEADRDKSTDDTKHDADGVSWMVVGITAGVLVVIFLVGIELLR